MSYRRTRRFTPPAQGSRSGAAEGGGAPGQAWFTPDRGGLFAFASDGAEWISFGTDGATPIVSELTCAVRLAGRLAPLTLALAVTDERPGPDTLY